MNLTFWCYTQRCEARNSWWLYTWFVWWDVCDDECNHLPRDFHKGEISCGVLWVQHLRVGVYEVKEPMVVGHESSGIIAEIGSNVKHLAVGDRVALEPGVPCWKCNYCKEGLYNLCPDMQFFATPPVHGALANQVQFQCWILFLWVSTMSFLHYSFTGRVRVFEGFLIFLISSLYNIREPSHLCKRSLDSTQ